MILNLSPHQRSQLITTARAAYTRAASTLAHYEERGNAAQVLGWSWEMDKAAAELSELGAPV
jgi:hypothetical protein